MKKTILSIVLGACIIATGVSMLEAQTPPSSVVNTASTGAPSISGDEVCGGKSDSNDPAANECTANDLKKVGTRMLSIFTLLGSALLVAFIVLKIVQSWFAYREGDAGAIKKAGQDAFNAVIGFFIVFAVAGGLYVAALSYFGTQPWAQQFFKFFADALIPHAYAQAAADQLLPNALGSTSAYDILISAINLTMRFFVYPAIIVMWVWSGFQFVYSRGNPDGLNKAKSWVFWAFLITVIVLMLQGFLLAFRNTANKVLGTPAAMNIPVIHVAGIDAEGRRLW